MIHHILTDETPPQGATALWAQCGLPVAMRDPHTGETWWAHLALPPSKVAGWRQTWETPSQPVCRDCLESERQEEPTGQQ